MKHKVRAGGIAAASLALVATTASAGPSVATSTTAIPAVLLADHINASVADDRTMDKLVSANTGTEPAGPVASAPAAKTTRCRTS